MYLSREANSTLLEFLGAGLLGNLAGLSGLLHRLRLLCEDELNVRGRRHVGVDTTVSAISTTTELGCGIGLHVIDDEVLDVEALHFGVRLSVLEEIEEEAARLLGPTTLSGTMCLGLCGTTSIIGEAAEGHTLLLGNNVIEEGLGALEAQALKGLAGLAGVLEVNTEIGTTGLGDPVMMM